PLLPPPKPPLPPSYLLPPPEALEEPQFLQNASPAGFELPHFEQYQFAGDGGGVIAPLGLPQPEQNAALPKLDFPHEQRHAMGDALRPPPTAAPELTIEPYKCLSSSGLLIRGVLSRIAATKKITGKIKTKAEPPSCANATVNNTKKSNETTAAI
ncbi:MAG: hypothetical protein Q4C01_07680, partial [Clostridia bacterium]|nr:hypothetical protein [Clostridia bacterium]